MAACRVTASGAAAVPWRTRGRSRLHELRIPTVDPSPRHKGGRNRLHELRIPIVDLCKHRPDTKEDAHRISRPRERDEQPVHVLVVRQVRVAQRHAKGHHVDNHPRDGDVSEHRVVPSPLQGVEGLRDAAGDGDDEAGDENDPMEDHVVARRVARVFLRPSRLGELLLQSLHGVLVIFAILVDEAIHHGDLGVGEPRALVLVEQLVLLGLLLLGLRVAFLLGDFEDDLLEPQAAAHRLPHPL
mmetsp:Transcript_32519/g.85394  ORF Transcript_32519/g.85394 Transcript_32519/m.85394 type:complete len:242 (-) Transcript_32519:1460-2185(-)